MADFDQLKETYWRTVAGTRKSHRIAQSVKDRVEESWKQFDDDVVSEALQIHISRYKEYKENYTIGIMRNLQKQKQNTGKIGTENQFAKIEQRKYDYDALEKALLAAQ